MSSLLLFRYRIAAVGKLSTWQRPLFSSAICRQNCPSRLQAPSTIFFQRTTMWRNQRFLQRKFSEKREQMKTGKMEKGYFDRWTLNADGTTRHNFPGRLRGLWRKYGVVAIGTYFSVYFATLGLLYSGVELYAWHLRRKFKERRGIASDAEINKEIVKEMGLESFPAAESLVASWGTLAIAWIAAKFTEPVRLAITLAITPSIAKVLGRVPK